MMERKGDNSPVYQVSPENGKGRDRVVPRNLLLPCNHLPLDHPPHMTPQLQRGSQGPTKRKTKLQRKELQRRELDGDSDDSYCQDGGRSSAESDTSSVECCGKHNSWTSLDAYSTNFTVTTALHPHSESAHRRTYGKFSKPIHLTSPARN